MKPYETPFSTQLSGNAKETELRLRSIFQWQKKRPPLPVLAVAIALAVGCGSLVGCKPQAVAPPPASTDTPAVPSTAPTTAPDVERSTLFDDFFLKLADGSHPLTLDALHATAEKLGLGHREVEGMFEATDPAHPNDWMCGDLTTQNGAVELANMVCYLERDDGVVRFLTLQFDHEQFDHETETPQFYIETVGPQTSDDPSKWTDGTLVSTLEEMQEYVYGSPQKTRSISDSSIKGTTEVFIHGGLQLQVTCVAKVEGGVPTVNYVPALTRYYLLPGATLTVLDADVSANDPTQANWEFCQQTDHLPAGESGIIPLLPDTPPIPLTQDALRITSRNDFSDVVEFVWDSSPTTYYPNPTGSTATLITQEQWDAREYELSHILNEEQLRAYQQGQKALHIFTGDPSDSLNRYFGKDTVNTYQTAEIPLASSQFPGRYFESTLDWDAFETELHTCFSPAYYDWVMEHYGRDSFRSSKDGKVLALDGSSGYIGDYETMGYVPISSDANQVRFWEIVRYRQPNDVHQVRLWENSQHWEASDTNNFSVRMMPVTLTKTEDGWKTAEMWLYV